jgi:sugar (pentulose or hexulose) kinase
MKKEAIIAADVGAGSVKIMAVLFDGRHLEIREIKRFSNQPLSIRGNLYNDIGNVYSQMKDGFKTALHTLDMPVRSIGIDTFGNDYGFLNLRGELAGLIYNYRDKRTADYKKFKSTSIESENRYYAVTGIADKSVIAYNQLLAYANQADRAEIEQISAFLMLPDLFGYFLTGNMSSEYVISSITGLVDINSGFWSDYILSALPFPRSIFKTIVPSGFRAGLITDDDLAAIKGQKPELIKTVGHDSGAAVTAMPTADAIHIICGSWSLVGIELSSPLINEQTRLEGLSNQGLPFGKVRLEKPLPGLWVLQQCLLEWQMTQPDLNFANVETLASLEGANVPYIDIEQPEFLIPGGMSEKIRHYCRQTGQCPPESAGAIAACIYRSLAIKYKRVVTVLERIVNRSFNDIYLLGGGSKDAFLGSLTAGVTSKRVISGLSDASALGNAIIQMVTLGYVDGLEQARILIGDSFQFRYYTPQHSDWNEALQRAEEIEKVYVEKKKNL